MTEESGRMKKWKVYFEGSKIAEASTASGAKALVRVELEKIGVMVRSIRTYRRG